MADMMRRIDQVVEAENAQRVTGVRVWIGALAHISADHFREHFEAAARETAADGAVVEIELSTDVDDPHAQDIKLVAIDVEQREKAARTD